VKQRPEANGAVVVPAAALGAGGPPLSADVLDVAAPPAAGAVGSPHVLPEGRGHCLLARVGKVDAHHAAEAAAHHILDDVLAHTSLVSVYGPNGAPSVLDPLHVAYNSAVGRLQGEPVEVPEVPVTSPALSDGDDAVVPLLPEVGAHVEVASSVHSQSISLFQRAGSPCSCFLMVSTISGLRGPLGGSASSYLTVWVLKGLSLHSWNIL